VFCEEFANNMTSCMECISWSNKQTESLSSTVSIMRIRWGAPKKRRRVAYFRGSSSQSIDEMTVEIESESEEEENKEESQTEDTE
jgi:hypothetical protein